MKLLSDNETLAENKALILYIINKVSKPISNDAFFKLVLSAQNMNYFYFQQFLLDLLDNKYIITYNQNNESIYEITEEGKHALNLVQDLIPGIIKFNIDNSFKDNLNKIENEVAITAEYIPHSETDYSVKCNITENNRILFSVETFAGSRRTSQINC